MTMTDPAVTEEAVRDALRQVVDPELGCNLVELGLIYDLRVLGNRVAVKLTFTTRGCPMHDSLIGGVEAALSRLPGVQGVDIEVVWDPPWTPDRMSLEAKARLGCA